MGQLNHNLGSCEQRIMELLNNTNIKNLRPYVLVLNKPGGKWKIIKTKAPKKSIYTLIPFFNLADGRWARQQPHRAKAGSPPNPSFLEGSIRMVTVSLNIFNGICWNPPTPQASGTCFSCDPNECENPSALSQTFSEMEIATQEPMIGKWLTAAWKNSVGNRFLLDFPDLEGRRGKKLHLENCSGNHRLFQGQRLHVGCLLHHQRKGEPKTAPPDTHLGPLPP